jgi:hypothetical protein
MVSNQGDCDLDEALMNSAKTIRWRVVAVSALLILNAAFLFWAINRRDASPVQPSDQRFAGIPTADSRATILKDWISAPVVDASDPQLGPQLATALDHDCAERPDGFQAFPANRLTEAQRNDLVDTLQGLVVVYAQSSPEAIIEYMKKRGEALSPQMMVDKRKDDLAQHQADSSNKISDAAVWAWYWRFWKYGAAWQGVVIASTCVSMSTCPASDWRAVEANMTLAPKEKQAWSNTIYYPHHFASVDESTLEFEAKSATQILVADVQLVIAHTEAIYGQRSPYLVRLWYNERSRHWQFAVLSRARIDLSRGDGVKFMY